MKSEEEIKQAIIQANNQIKDFAYDGDYQAAAERRIWRFALEWVLVKSP